MLVCAASRHIRNRTEKACCMMYISGLVNTAHRLASCLFVCSVSVTVVVFSLVQLACLCVDMCF